MYTHAPPMHQPLHGPACPSTKIQIPPHLTEGHQSNMILLLSDFQVQYLETEHLKTGVDFINCFCALRPGAQLLRQ